MEIVLVNLYGIAVGDVVMGRVFDLVITKTSAEAELDKKVARLIWQQAIEYLIPGL